MVNMRATRWGSPIAGGVWLAVALGCPASGGAPPATPDSPVRSIPATVDPTPPPPAIEGERHRVESLTITILSTTKAPQGIGEWGFSALVEADGARILFDTGAHPKTVLRNAEALGIDLATVPMVVLSHHHDDHVGGLVTLRKAVAAAAPEALATVHGARALFEPRRYGAKTHEVNDMIGLRPTFEATGGRFVLHDHPTEIAAGVWVTGPVPRPHDERNFSGQRRLSQRSPVVADHLPESQSLVIETPRGLVVLSGCGHAGIVNTTTYAQQAIADAPIHAAVGGFHLFRASAEHLDWTVEQLAARGLTRFAAAHCTGDAAVARMNEHPAVEQSLELGVGGQFVVQGGTETEPT